MDYEKIAYETERRLARILTYLEIITYGMLSGYGLSRLIEPFASNSEAWILISLAFVVIFTLDVGTFATYYLEEVYPEGGNE